MSRFVVIPALFAVFCLSACGGSGSTPATSPTPTPIAASLPSAESLIARIATQDGASDSTSEMQFVIESGSNREQIVFRQRRLYSPDTVSTLMEVTSPPEDTDKVLLAFQRKGAPTEAVSYLAGLKKVARLSSENTLTLRDSKLSIQELLWLELGQYSAGPGEAVVEQGETLAKYSLTAPAERKLAFPQITAWFRTNDRTPVRFECFDDAQKLQRTIRVDEVKEIDSRLTMTRVTIEHHAQEKKMLLTIRSIKFNTGLSPKLFTESSLIATVKGASRQTLGGN